jgi:acyl-CoA synthetase (AMP-forming)/AMP-acid ligase II
VTGVSDRVIAGSGLTSALGAERSFRVAADRIVSARPDFRWLTILNGSGRQTFTLAQLARRQTEFAAEYARRGVEPDDVVLIVLRESLDLFASFFAALSHGAVPAYYAYPSPKQPASGFVDSLQHLLTYNRVRLVVTYDEAADVVAATGSGKRAPSGRAPRHRRNACGAAVRS